MRVPEFARGRKLCPCGDRVAAWVRPISPMSPLHAGYNFVGAALSSAMLIKKTVMIPSGMLTASAVSKWTRISGIGAVDQQQSA